MVVVMTPKFDCEMSALGAPYWARFKALKRSPRKRKLTCSVIGTNFERPRSTCEIPAARNAFRPRFPKVPLAGTAKAAGLIHSFGVEPPGGVSDTPGTRLGRSEPLTE